MRADSTQGQLETLLLGVMAAGPAHGYRVIELLRERSGGTFDLPEGTVYPALHRLERDGLLASAWDSGSGRRRRVYRITERGHTQLAGGRERWLRFSHAVSEVLEAPAGA
jgi:DNA-binding PadR family transcriptional regulator